MDAPTLQRLLDSCPGNLLSVSSWSRKLLAYMTYLLRLDKLPCFKLLDLVGQRTWTL